MPEHLLNIHWSYGSEYVPIPTNANDVTVTTSERWNGSGTVVTYSARLKQPDLEHHRFALRYVREDQTDPEVLDPDNGILWGRSEITWQPGLRTGTVVWHDDDGTISRAAPVDVLGGEAPVAGFRDTVSVIVKSRPGQQALRNQILCLDARCVILGNDRQRRLRRPMSSR